jgi:hypothetical protein
MAKQADTTFSWAVLIQAKTHRQCMLKAQPMAKQQNAAAGELCHSTPVFASHQLALLEVHTLTLHHLAHDHSQPHWTTFSKAFSEAQHAVVTHQLALLEVHALTAHHLAQDHSQNTLDYILKGTFRSATCSCPSPAGTA